MKTTKPAIHLGDYLIMFVVYLTITMKKTIDFVAWLVSHVRLRKTKTYKPACQMHDPEPEDMVIAVLVMLGILVTIPVALWLSWKIIRHIHF